MPKAQPQSYHAPFSHSINQHTLHNALNSSIPTELKTTLVNNIFNRYLTNTAIKYHFDEAIQNNYFNKLCCEQDEERQALARKQALNFRRSMKIDPETLRKQLQIFYTLFLLNIYHVSRANIFPCYLFPYHRIFMLRSASTFVSLLERLAIVLASMQLQLSNLFAV